MCDGMDALVLYCMLRHFRPRQVIEVGCGFSDTAARRGHAAQWADRHPVHRAVPRSGLEAASPVKLLERRVQDVALSEFERLDSGDFLFIDSSHTLKIGGDVNYLWLEVIPSLKPGVIVHLHDIFLPSRAAERVGRRAGCDSGPSRTLLHAYPRVQRRHSKCLRERLSSTAS